MKRTGYPTTLLGLLGLLGLLALAAPAGAQTYRTDLPAAPARVAGFGGAVAVGDGEILIGEPRNSYRPGLVHRYGRDASGAWVERGRLSAPDGKERDGFGRTMAVDGSTALIASGGDGSGEPAVHVFRRGSDGAWSHEARLAPPAGEGMDGYAVSLAVSGEWALVGSFQEGELAGAAYLYRRASTGEWSPAGRLGPEDLQAGDRFGVTLALEGEWAVVAATRQDSAAGSAYVFRRDAAGEWRPAGKLRGASAGPNSRFGSEIEIAGDRMLISAFAHDDFTGAVFEFELDPDSGEWEERVRLLPFDGTPQAQFGITMAMPGDELLVGAPGASRFSGAVYVFRRDPATGSWDAVRRLTVPGLDQGDFFAGSLDARGSLGVAGVTGDDFGQGAAVILERDAATGEWGTRTRLIGETESLDPVVGGKVECAEGAAALFDCRQVDLLSFLPVSAIGGGRGVNVNDVWGWKDPQTGREYALVGRVDGTAFVDITDPHNPLFVGDLPRTEGAPPSTWRDIKVYRNHAFIVADGAQEHGMQVFDLTRLRGVRNAPATFTHDAHYTGIHSAHNIVINEDKGFAFAVGNSAGGETCGGGLHMIDIREPKRPTFAGCFSDPSTGRQKTGYTHDAQCVTYGGPDAAHRGKEICFGANETALSIADVTDKENPIALSRAEYPNVGYSHQGWLTEDHRYFFMDDELDEIQAQAQGGLPGTRTLIFDVADLDDPVLLKEFFGTTKATDHNLYIRGHYMYQSNYVAGLRVVDIRDVENPVEVGYFDTVPFGENAPGFGGSWSNYPFFDSGSIVVTSGSEGVFVLQKRPELVP